MADTVGARCRAAAGIALTALSLAACGSGGTTEIADRNEALEAALLTVDDLPRGFDDDTTLPDDEGSGFDDCSALSESFETDADAMAVFVRGTEVVVEDIVELPVDQAEQAMADLARAPEECDGTTGEFVGLEMTFDVEPLDVADLGEDTIGLRFTVAVEAIDSSLGQPIEEHLVARRQGGTIVTMTFLQVGKIDGDFTESLSRTAYEKASDLW